MESASFMKVDEVAQELGVSKSYAYKIVQKLNAELAEKCYMVISGRVKKKQILGEFSIAIPIGMANESNHKNEDSKQNVRLRRGKENNLISLAEIWI